MAKSKFKTENLTSDVLPAVDLSPERWDNRDPFDDMAEIFAEFLEDQERIEREIAALKAKVKGHQAAKADLRKVVSGRLSIDLAEIDDAVRLSHMSDEERKLATDRQHRALVLACHARGVPVPPIQMDMDAIWSGMKDPGPVADRTEAAA